MSTGKSPRPSAHTAMSGLTLVELMVAMSIGLVLIGGALYVYSQSSNSYRASDSIARLHETARFALDEVEASVRHAGYWGLNAATVDVPPGLVIRCTGTGTDVTAWAFGDAGVAVEASDNTYDLPCPAFNGAPRTGSDVLVVRHAAPAGSTPTVPEAGRVQVQSNLQGSQVFDDGMAPDLGPDARTFDVVVSAYYVSEQSSFSASQPSLRRLTLKMNGVMGDEEVIPGVENLQVQFGVDTTGDGNANRYVDAGHPLLLEAGVTPVAVRLWMLIATPADDRAWRDEAVYDTPDGDLGPIVPGGADYPADARRLQVSKTILLRNRGS